MGFSSTLISIVIGIIGLAVGYAVRKYISEGKLKNAEELSKKIIYDAENQAQTQKKMLLVEAKEEIQKLRSEQENEAKLRRAEIKELEDRVLSKERQLDKKSSQVERKDEKLSKKLEGLRDKENQADELVKQREEELQKVAVQNIEDTMPLPVDFVSDKELFILKVSGESMINAGIFDGDYEYSW